MTRIDKILDIMNKSQDENGNHMSIKDSISNFSHEFSDSEKSSFDKSLRSSIQ